MKSTIYNKVTHIDIIVTQPNSFSRNNIKLNRVFYLFFLIIHFNNIIRT